MKKLIRFTPANGRLALLAILVCIACFWRASKDQIEVAIICIYVLNSLGIGVLLLEAGAVWVSKKNAYGLDLFWRRNVPFFCILAFAYLPLVEIVHFRKDVEELRRSDFPKESDIVVDSHGNFFGFWLVQNLTVRSISGDSSLRTAMLFFYPRRIRDLEKVDLIVARKTEIIISIAITNQVSD